MGQYWGKGEEKGGGIVKTATVKTICDGSAERAAPHHTSKEQLQADIEGTQDQVL